MYLYADQSGQLLQLQTLVVVPALVATVVRKLVLNLRADVVPVPVVGVVVPGRSSVVEQNRLRHFQARTGSLS